MLSKPGGLVSSKLPRTSDQVMRVNSLCTFGEFSLILLSMSDRDRHISFRSDRNVRPSGRLWNPAADVYKIQGGWVVKIDLAGVRPDEIELEVQGGNLRVRGCRRDSFYQEGF